MAKTKREMFAEIRNAVIDNAEMVAFIDHEVELLNRRNGGTRKPTKAQKENEGIMEAIVEGLLEMDKPVTVTELINDVDGLAGYTNQKISALLRKLVEAERVVKTMEKKKAYFAVA